jgi:thioredoxin-like negative regulator of GroEL
MTLPSAEGSSPGDSKTPVRREAANEQRSPTPRPRLVYFFSPTDGRSRRVDGFLDAVLQRRGNHDTFEVIRVDVSRRADLAERFRIGVVPTIVVIESNRVKGRLERPGGNAAIAEFLQQWLVATRGRDQQGTDAVPAGHPVVPRPPAPEAATRP